MVALQSNTLISSSKYRARILEVMESLLPSSGTYQSNSTNLPKFANGVVALPAEFLCLRSDLIDDIKAIINDQKYVNINPNLITKVSPIFPIMQDLLLEAGRCRKVDYYNYSGGNPPNVVTASTGRPAGQGVWTYFKKNFTFTDKYRAPTTSGNSNVDYAAYQTNPANTTNWNTNTKSKSSVSKLGTLNPNNIMYAVKTIETQLNNFRNEFTSRNSTNTWWNGSATSPNESNRIFWIGYWCHSNCHSNCHGSRGRR